MSEHGTRSRYTHGQCRCELCCVANTTYKRRYYAANPEKKQEENSRYRATHPEEESARFKQMREERRAKCLAILGGVCARCGATDETLPNGRPLLEFDHLDPSTKKFEIASRITLGWAKLLRELKKCQLMCVPCHQRKTKRDAKKQKGSS